jgi:hypothetical protein
MYEQDSRQIVVDLACGHKLTVVYTNLVNEDHVRDQYRELRCIFCEEKDHGDNNEGAGFGKVL